MVGVLDSLIGGGRPSPMGMGRGVMGGSVMGTVPGISMRGVSATPFRPFLGPQPVATGQLDPRDFPTGSMLSRGLMASGGGAAQAPAARPQGLLGSIRSGLGGMSEEMALGLAGSLLGGPTRTPVGFGTKILQGLQAGREAEKAKRQETLLNLLTEGKISELMRKSSSAFSGTGVMANALNFVVENYDDYNTGKLSADDKVQFELARQIVEKPTTQTSIDPSSGETVVSSVPGIDVDSIINPYTAGGGTELSRKAQPLTEGQSRSLGFAQMAHNAEVEMQNVLRDYPDFNPADLDENIFKYTPGGFEGYAQTPAGQRYWTAAAQWVESSLRQKSGAAIPDAERAAETRDLFPRPGDSPSVVEQKRRAREVRWKSLVSAAGEDIYRRSDPGRTEYGVLLGTKQNPFTIDVDISTEGLSPEEVKSKLDAEINKIKFSDKTLMTLRPGDVYQIRDKNGNIIGARQRGRL